MNGLPPGFELDPEPAHDDFAQRAGPLMQKLSADFGLTPEQAAGIVGNLGHESAGLQAGIQERNPTAGRGGLGWAQWTGPRRRSFEKYLQDTGRPATDPEANYGYLKAELTGQIPGHDYSGALDAVRKSSGLDDSMMNFERTYERAGVKNYPARLGYARKALGSSQHVAGMREKYTPSLFQQAAGRLFDAVIPAAQAADHPPPGNGVMLPQGFDVDPEPQAMGGLPPGFDLDPEPEAQPHPSGMSPTAQTAIRSTVKGLTAPIAMVSDAVGAVPNLIAKGINTVRPGTVGYIPPAAQGIDSALRSFGVNPEPASAAERAVTAALGAAAGAPLFGGQAAIGTVSSQVAGAASASVASDIASESGLPYPAQIAAGVLGGMVPGAAGVAINAVGRPAKSIAAIASPEARRTIAGRVLSRHASAPQSSLSRVRDSRINKQLIDGSAPTLAEVTQDPGIAKLQRFLTSSKAGQQAGADQINAVRIAQMDEAIRKTLDRVNKAPKEGASDVLDSVQKIKERISANFGARLQENGIDPADLQVGTTNLERTLSELSRKHQGKTAIEDMISKTAAKIEGGTNFTRLWNNRQDIDDVIYEKLATVSGGSKMDMKRVGEQIRAAMNADLVEAVPEFRPFLNRYARMARAEGRIKLGRKLVKGAENTSRNIADGNDLYGDRVLSGAKIDRVDISEAERKSGVKLSKAQRMAFEAAQQEKARANILTTGGSTINSSTAQNINMDQILMDDILGATDATRQSGVASILRNSLQNIGGKGVAAISGAAQNDIIRMIQRGLIDPEEGAALMQLGQSKGSQSFANRLRGAGKAGVLSEIYSNMVR